MFTFLLFLITIILAFHFFPNLSAFLLWGVMFSITMILLMLIGTGMQQ